MPEVIYDCVELRPGMPEPYPIKILEDNRVLLKLSPNDALELAKELIEAVDSHHDIKPVADPVATAKWKAK